MFILQHHFSEFDDTRAALSRQRNNGVYVPLRLYGRNRGSSVISVTDVTSGLWCEVKVEYRHLHPVMRRTSNWKRLEEKGAPVMLRTPVMKEGTSMHLKKGYLLSLSPFFSVHVYSFSALFVYVLNHSGCTFLPVISKLHTYMYLLSKLFAHSGVPSCLPPCTYCVCMLDTVVKSCKESMAVLFVQSMFVSRRISSIAVSRSTRTTAVAPFHTHDTHTRTHARTHTRTHAHTHTHTHTHTLQSSRCTCRWL